MSANRNMVIDMATKRPVRRRDLPPTHILPLTPNAYHERRRAKLRKMSGWLREQRKPKPAILWTATNMSSIKYVWRDR